jgi:SPP1 gp7 family putative phage head morphogenesis protein
MVNEKEAIKREKKYQKQLMEAYANSYREINHKVAKLYEKYSKDGTLSLSEMYQYDRLTKLYEEIRQELVKLTGVTKQDLNKYLKIEYDDSYYREAFRLESEIQANLSYSLLNPKVVENAIRNPMKEIALQNNRNKVITSINSEIAQGFIQGESYPKMAKRIKKALETNLNNEMRIARTEAHRCQELGNTDSREFAKNKGIKMRQRWVSGLDSRTRPEHQSADGQEVEIGEPFIVGGEELKHPGDPVGSAGNVINCRCTTISVIEGFEPEFRRIRGEGIVPYKTYEEWKGVKIEGKKPKEAEPKVFKKVFKEEDYARVNLRGEEIKQYLEEHSNYINGLSREEQEGIREYSGDAYTIINKYLRTSEVSEERKEQVEGLVKGLKGAFKNAPELKDNIIMNRKVYSEDINKIFSNLNLDTNVQSLINDANYEYKQNKYNKTDNNININKLRDIFYSAELNDKAVMSTSYNPDVWDGDVQFDFYLEKGYKDGIFIESISKHSSEKEYLLNMNLKFEIFDVVGDNTDGSDRIHFKVRPKE